MERDSIVMGRRFTLLGAGGVLLFIGGCLGPNPLFFLGTSATNAAVMRLVNMAFDTVLSGG